MRSVNAARSIPFALPFGLPSATTLTYDFLYPAIAFVVVFVVGAFGARIVQTLIRRRRAAAPAMAVVPGGLDLASGSSRRQRIVPAELPPPPGLLAGRDRELDEMCDHLTRPDRDGGALIVIHGEPGIGKTALAIRMAHLVSDQYPDGQLMLRFDSSDEQLTEDRLETFVRALRGPREVMPERADLGRWYRDWTRRRRVLVILDNIGDPDQIRPLLPAGPGCLTMVTARGAVPGFPGHFPVALEPLGDEAATALLDRLVGGDRIGAEPEEAQQIVAAAAGYPVAIQMAGAVLAVRKNWTLEIAVRRMRDMATDLRRRKVVAFSGILDLAFALLTREEREALVLLGLTDRRRVERWMLAMLFNGAFADRAMPENVAGRFLDHLASARFVERRVDDHSGLLTFRVPVYVHAYAETHLDSYLTGPQQRRARRELSEGRRRRNERNVDDFLRMTVFEFLDRGQLDAALNSARESLALCRERAAAMSSTDSGALAFATEEGLTLAALAEVNAELGWVDEAMTGAEDAAKRGSQSPRTLARALRVTGSLRRRLRQLPQAESDLLAAERSVQNSDDRDEHIRVLCELTALQAPRKDLDAATRYFEQARRLCASEGPSGARQLPAVLLAYAQVLRECGNPEAGTTLAEAERLTGDPDGWQRLRRPWIRLHRALTLLDLGKYDQSREFSSAALEGFTTLRHRYGSGYARLALGRAHLADGNLSGAIPELEECHGTFRRCGDRWIEAESATWLAAAYHRAERGQEAVDLLSAAEQAFSKLGDEQGVRRAGRQLWEVESSLPAQPLRPLPGVREWMAAVGRQATDPAGTRAGM
ncbi:NB-ARC domain-containing protein [Micromonospora parva]|uniref:NB-ARC domain-containing protein n=1 Tax=Micromonospora parva TaxID=1464048 RepID=UPI00378BEC83